MIADLNPHQPGTVEWSTWERDRLDRAANANVALKTHNGIGSQITAAIESAWSDIQARHPEVPDVVATMAGSSHRRGHFGRDRWQNGVGKLAELFVAGEILGEGPVSVMKTLLHEGAHGLATTRGIKDCSRAGNAYHNKRFKALAEELGLQVAYRSAGHGWTECAMPDELIAQYAATLERLAAALEAYRLGDQTGQAKSRNYIPLKCRCPNTIRMSQQTADFYGESLECPACRSPFRQNGWDI